ncbi:PTS transporter subunit EIIC [Erysipelotrichaceae bacterium RD49]|nr:PTS transporter subunit EIIC [Erysipelotrichaceae bacterium RD49]
MNNRELASLIMEKTGGKQNVQDAANCMTRLRMHVNHPEKVMVEEIKEIPGVMSVIVNDNYYQIVLGPGKAQKVTDEFKDLIGAGSPESSIEPDDKMNLDGDWQSNKAGIKAQQKKNPFKDFANMIASIFVPMLPAIIAAGLFNGFGSLIGQLISSGNIAGDFWTMIQLVFNLIGSSFLGYLVIYTGINAAKVFGATPAMGGMIGGISIGANIVSISTMLGLYNEEIPLNSILTTGKGGVVGVILGVWVLSLVEKWIRKRMPDLFDLILTPFLSLLITGLLMIFVIMPVAGFASDWLVAGLSVLLNSSNPVVSVISGYVLAALFLPMVLLGLHQGLIPIYTIQLETMGGISLFPVLAMAGAGQVGAAIAIWIKARKVGNRKMEKIIAGALPAGFLGVGEPLIYGVTLPLGKPFVTAGLGAGFGGAYIMLTHVMANAFGPSGLVAIPLMQGTSGMLNFFIGLVIAYIGGFIITYFGIKSSAVANAK